LKEYLINKGFKKLDCWNYNNILIYMYIESIQIYNKETDILKNFDRRSVNDIIIKNYIEKQIRLNKLKNILL